MVKDQKASTFTAYTGSVRPGKITGEQNSGLRSGGILSTRNTPPAVVNTAQPTNQQIRCLECGYEYKLTGRMPKTHCPKCRSALDLAGFTINGECHEELKTLGTIRIVTGAVVTGARLVATDIILASRIADSSVEAFRQLVVQAGAEFSRRDIRAADLRVDPGAEIALSGPTVYRHIEILGRMRANLYCTGMVMVRTGGFLIGEAHCAHLLVEDGAGIIGNLRVCPEGGEDARKAQELLGSSPAGQNDEKVIVTGYDVPAVPSGC